MSREARLGRLNLSHLKDSHEGLYAELEKQEKEYHQEMQRLQRQHQEDRRKLAERETRADLDTQM